MKYLLAILLALFYLSCANTNNKSDLCQETTCGSGYECNKDIGKCEKIENYCINNTQCKTNERCDKIHKRCIVVPDTDLCENHTDCETWEICDFSTKECSPRTNMCNEDRDCINYPFLKCHTSNHQCEDPHDCYYTGCNEWEKCSSNGECKLIDGLCNNNTDCENKFPYNQCNLETHKCQVAKVPCTSYTQCNSWEICSSEQGICTNEPGNCTSFLDCIDNTNGKTECDISSHLCKKPSEFNCSNIGCSQFWRTCNETTGSCDLENNSCDDDDDCSGAGIEICNLNHKCVRNDCTVFGCSWWQECNSDTGVCSPRPTMCANNNDCLDDAPFTICNTLIHFCKKPENMECTEDRHCDDWEACNLNTNKCILKDGYCINNGQCLSEQTCNLNDHRCN